MWVMPLFLLLYMLSNLLETADHSWQMWAKDNCGMPVTYHFSQLAQQELVLTSQSNAAEGSQVSRNMKTENGMFWW